MEENKIDYDVAQQNATAPPYMRRYKYIKYDHIDNVDSDTVTSYQVNL